MNSKDLWYKDSIIYCLDVETYQDSDGDGIGDFRGLITRLPEISSLGINCIWLLPFYPSPNRDNGYDITDYYSVDPRLGTLGDFVEFMLRAKEYGIRVIVDLVVNHTSIDHPWFQAARADENSIYRDFYVWSDEKPEDADEGVVFPGVQESVWTYDRKAEAYYFHRFYKHQADLNIDNPAVRQEIKRIMGFWLQLGVSGFRVDAAPFLIELKGLDNPTTENPFGFLREMRQFLSWRKGDAIILAEANIAMDEVKDYFGDGTKLQMIFHFMLNQHLFLAMATGDAKYLKEGLNAPPEIPDTGQWAIFLRNHDEIDLGRLSDDERQLAFQAFGPDENMQIYDRGIRRRLAPMLHNDRRCLELAYSLMFTLPGTPVLRYGQEIGMGDDLSLKERNSVRTPMQWSREKNAGFSKANADALIRPVINEGDFSYEKVNFADQQRDPDSLLNWMERIIRARKQCPEFGFGKWEIVKTGDDGVFAHSCKWHEKEVVAVHNLRDKKATITLKHPKNTQLIDVLGNKVYTLQDGSEEVKLDAYGYRWFRVQYPES
ncbi:MAG: alpha-amylase family protein [Aggregatilineales bacterium]